MKCFNKIGLVDLFIGLLLFFAAMSFLGNNYIYIYCAFLVLLLKKPTFKIGVAFWSLLLLSLSIVFWGMSDSQRLLDIVMAFVFPIAYLMGYSLGWTNSRKYGSVDYCERSCFIHMVILAIGCFIHFMLNMFNNMGAVTRNTNDFWNGSYFSATGQASIAIIPVGVFIALIFTDIKMIYKVLSAIITVLIAYYNLTLSTRTVFILMIVVFCVAFIRRFINFRGEKKRLVLVSGTVILIIICVLMYNYNFLGMKDTVENSLFNHRFTVEMDINQDGRMEQKLEYLKLMPRYIWGGNHILDYTGGFAHDLFLDTYDKAGIISLLAVIIFFVNSLYSLKLVLKSKMFSFAFVQVFLAFSLVCIMEFFIEPILIGVRGCLRFIVFLLVLLSFYLVLLKMKCD